jgi:DNA-binding NarL/FixJ family response regulator
MDDTCTKIYPNVVYYNDDHSKTPKCTAAISEITKISYILPSTWKELVSELEDGAEFLAFHVDMIERSIHSTPAEFIDAITTIIKFIPKSKNLKIAVIIKPSTTRETIKKLQKVGVQGLLLDINYYSIEDVAAAVNAFINNIPYWPKHIINSLPTPTKKKHIQGKIVLTPRQQQVFLYITERGASNKVIARGLGISESTVKLHITELFKKYGVRNRTQLAVFTQA